MPASASRSRRHRPRSHRWIGSDSTLPVRPLRGRFRNRAATRPPFAIDSSVLRYGEVATERLPGTRRLSPLGALEHRPVGWPLQSSSVRRKTARVRPTNRARRMFCGRSSLTRARMPVAMACATRSACWAASRPSPNWYASSIAMPPAERVTDERRAIVAERDQQSAPGRHPPRRRSPAGRAASPSWAPVMFITRGRRRGRWPLAAR